MTYPGAMWPRKADTETVPPVRYYDDSAKELAARYGLVQR
jgi:hypothetical protein